MSRKLLKQIRSEWKSNLWLAVELFIVSVVMWYIVDNFYVSLSVYNEPRGFNIEHTYKLNFNHLSESSPAFSHDADDSEDLMKLLERVQRIPFVEAAGLGQNAHPYNGSNSGSELQIDTFNLNEGYIIRRVVTPDFMRVFRYEGANGETPEQLAEMIKKGNILLSNNLLDDHGHKVTEYVGQTAYRDGNTGTPLTIGAALNRVKYGDYMPWMDRTMFFWDPRWKPYLNDLVIRVKPELDSDIEEQIMMMASRDLQVGNWYIGSVKSFSDIRRNFQLGNTNTIRNYSVGMGFLLLNIFLGLLGTFWFRTQQRVHEIAIRMTAGASRVDVFRRLLGEGLLILSMVTVLAIGADIALARMEFNAYYQGEYLQWGRLFICAGISYALIAVMIILGVSIPASRAMRIQPAVALHAE